MKITGKVTKAGQIVPMTKAAKSGEGSRGGHIIGHTKSGKPVYAETHESFKRFAHLPGRPDVGVNLDRGWQHHNPDWSAQDHADAAAIHGQRAKQLHEAASAADALGDDERYTRLSIKERHHREMKRFHGGGAEIGKSGAAGHEAHDHLDAAFKMLGHIKK